MRLSDHTSRKLTSFLAENNVIEPSTRELYSYCFDFVLDILFFNLSILIIGCLLRKPLPSLIYIYSMILAGLYMVFYIQNITVCYSIMTICVIIIAINQYIGICVNMLRQQ